MLTYYKIIYKKDVGATTFARSTYYGSRIALFVETSNAKPHAEYENLIYANSISNICQCASVEI